jgi:alpha-1,2-mannosyltransferase
METNALELRRGCTGLGVRRIAAACAYGALALQAIMLTYAPWLSGRWWLADFKGDFYAAGSAILHGRSPYAASYRLIALAHSFTSVPITPSKPAPILLAAVPFSLVPVAVSGAVFVAAMAGAILLALWLLGVRDWRCYLVTFCAYPTVLGLHLGNMSPLLLLGVAVLWRTRDQVLGPAVALAGIVLIKLFPWVMAVWMLITRRFKAAAWSLLIATVAVVAGWAVIGFAGFESYPRLLSRLDGLLAGSGASMSSWLTELGLPAADAARIALTGGLLLLAYAWLLARKGEQSRSFGVAVIATLVATPHAWDHYYVLLYAPIALMRPRISCLWLAPALVWPIAVEPALSVLALSVVLAAIVGKGRDCGTLIAGATARQSRSPSVAVRERSRVS